jgi:RNA polymerase sigma-70 factor (ECF subfamily)
VAGTNQAPIDLTGADPARLRAREEEALMLRRHREGDAEAFELLVRPHLTSLLSLSRRLAGARSGDELFQEALIRAYRGLHGFRAECSLRTWLFRITILLSKEPERWRTDRATSDRGLEHVPDSISGLPEQHARERELTDRLEEAMERLTVRQRTALHLRAVEGLDYRAIAGCMDTTDAAARRLVLLARKALLARLGPHLLP